MGQPRSSWRGPRDDRTSAGSGPLRCIFLTQRSLQGVPLVRPEDLGSMRQGYQYVIAQKFMRHPIKSRSPQLATRQPFQPRDYEEFQALALNDPLPMRGHCVTPIRSFHMKPSSSRADSDIRDLSHGGSQTSATWASVTPYTAPTLASTSPGIAPAAGQLGAVRVILM